MPYRYLLFLLLPALFSCGSPQKAYEDGKYEKAYKLALRKAERDKAERATLEILRHSLQKILEAKDFQLARELALEEFEKGLGNRQTREVLAQATDSIWTMESAEINNFSTSNSADDWEKALDKNKDLQILLSKSDVYLAGQFEQAIIQLEEEATILEDLLYEHYYLSGQEQLHLNDSTGIKYYAQNAYYDFKKARAFSLNEDKTLNELIQTARAKGTINYLIEPSTLSIMSYSWEVDRIFEGLEGQSGFRRVDYDGTMEDVDCLITLDFENLDTDIDKDTDTRTFEERIIVDYEIETDTAGNETEIPVYETVKGEVEIITQSKTISLEVDVEIESRSRNCSSDSDWYEASVATTRRIFTIRGDERAIPAEFLDTDDEAFEEEEELVEELLRQLYDEVHDWLW